jgi:hypothetical protein
MLFTLPSRMPEPSFGGSPAGAAGGLDHLSDLIGAEPWSELGRAAGQASAASETAVMATVRINRATTATQATAF